MLKLPKDIGRLFPYYKAQVYIYRTRLPDRDLKTRRVIKRYDREFMAIIGPLYFKEKQDIQGYLRQLAWANVKDGAPYDFDFAIKWLGVEHRKVKEDAGAPNNGHLCPRCLTMTDQGGPKDLCPKCSRA